MKGEGNRKGVVDKRRSGGIYGLSVEKEVT